MRISVAPCGTSPLAGDDHFAFYLGATRTTAACRSRFFEGGRCAGLLCGIRQAIPFFWYSQAEEIPPVIVVGPAHNQVIKAAILPCWPPGIHFFEPLLTEVLVTVTKNFVGHD
jgi:hypothetical protein